MSILINESQPDEKGLITLDLSFTEKLKIVYPVEYDLDKAKVEELKEMAVRQLLANVQMTIPRLQNRR